MKLKVKDISKNYNRYSALRGVNLELEPGLYGLLGPNGAGKSTLLKIIAGILRPTAGSILLDNEPVSKLGEHYRAMLGYMPQDLGIYPEFTAKRYLLYTPINGHIYVNGVDIEEISFSSLQQQISAVFQDFIRYPFNVAENIAIHDADNINDFERVKEAAVHSEATEFIDALPLGYRTTLEKEWNGGTELSGGQWQKIAIARCFYKSSSVVILDEPFSAIDSFSEEQIIKSLASDTINKMCIFVTHRFNNICLADQILVLKDAQLIENGTHAQLMATNGLYARLYHAQADAFFTLSQSEVQEE